MAQVIDASVAIAWCAQSQATPFTEAAMNAVVDAGGHVPVIFWFEVLHSLADLEQRGVIRRGHAHEGALQIAHMPLVIDAGYEPAEMIDLSRRARQHGLNIYDAAYLDLALRLGFPLATRDRVLARSAVKAGARLFTASSQ
jgi:predicted nucleic acid-binding protein